MTLPPSLDVITIDTAPDPVASVIVLHGLGADGNDFVPIARELELAAVGPVRFVFPHGPVRPVTVNGGHAMRAWYDIYGAEFGPAAVPREDTAGLRESQRLVDALIAAERARGVPAARIVLAGFSQGCAMTFMTGLRYPERLAGLMGLSGYLPLTGLTAAERHSANADVPIFQAHGSADTVIPIGRATRSRDALIALGHPVEWHTYPMPHSVCAEEIADMNAWLLKVLA
ncbi:MAG: alpha/beta hydrolase [Pseudomonadota bacterium]|nr:alpha/beta hydrolase [Pseudomonadota bacterium]